MESGNGSNSYRGTLPIILVAAVLQGWSLYGLHFALQHSRWPATHSEWLLGCYALALFVPITLQLLAGYIRQMACWIVIAAIAAAFFYFGWHHGADVVETTAKQFLTSDKWLPVTFVMGVLWLLLLPFLQTRLSVGHWRVPYQSLFATAWRNHFTLAEAGLFAILFWALLLLWQALFGMLGIPFFKELFSEPLFIYPVTALVFGIALHLIGSVARLTDVLLEQLLNVLKWLAIVAGLLLALFTIALALRLPGMIATGQRAISASWLLWLVAVSVLLVNAAFRDGSVGQPYPRPIALALRCVVPLLMVIAATALYALAIRVDSYGFTVERVWAWIVAAIATLYAVGYAAAAVRKGAWMAEVARVNVPVALFSIVVLALALSPVLSPYRIAANSQFRAAQEPPPDAGTDGNGRGTPLHYLRFNAGAYGVERLRQLSQIETHPRAAQVRDAAARMLAHQNASAPLPPDFEKLLTQTVVYPAGRTIDADLRARIVADLAEPNPRTLAADTQFAAAFVDLNDDRIEELVLFTPPVVYLYAHQADDWHKIGTMSATQAADQNLAAMVRTGDIAVQESVWRELRVGRQSFHFTSAQ